MTSWGDRGRLARLIEESREVPLNYRTRAQARDDIEATLDSHHDDTWLAYFSHSTDYEGADWIENPERVITRTFANCPITDDGLAIRARDNRGRTKRVVEVDVRRDASYAILGSQEGVYLRQNGGKEVQELLVLKVPED